MISITSIKSKFGQSLAVAGQLKHRLATLILLFGVMCSQSGCRYLHHWLRNKDMAGHKIFSSNFAALVLVLFGIAGIYFLFLDTKHHRRHIKVLTGVICLSISFLIVLARFYIGSR